MSEQNLSALCVSSAQPKPERHHDQTGRAAAAEVSEHSRVFSQTHLDSKDLTTHRT